MVLSEEEFCHSVLDFRVILMEDLDLSQQRITKGRRVDHILIFAIVVQQLIEENWDC